MFKFSAKLLTKKGYAWEGVDAKSHHRDVRYWTNRVLHGVTNQFQALMNNYKIKGVAFRDWVEHYGLPALLQSQDPEVRKATSDIRNFLKNYVENDFRDNESTAFKQQYGNNVTDWLYMLSGNKRASLLKKKGK